MEIEKDLLREMFNIKGQWRQIKLVTVWVDLKSRKICILYMIKNCTCTTSLIWRELESIITATLKWSDGIETFLLTMAEVWSAFVDVYKNYLAFFRKSLTLNREYKCWFAGEISWNSMWNRFEIQGVSLNIIRFSHHGAGTYMSRISGAFIFCLIKKCIHLFIFRSL